MVKSFENSRKVSFSQPHCINFMGLVFKNVFIRLQTSYFKINACFGSSFPLLLMHLSSADLRGKKPDIIIKKNHTPEDEKDSNGQI